MAAEMTTKVTIEVAVVTEMMEAVEIMMERKVAIRVISIIVIWIVGVPVGSVPNTTR